MKITGAYIDGFGCFHDQTLSGLDRDLVLFYGHNEAGKSTLLGFVRSVLFGFPRANSKDPVYLPAAGGVHGGRIDLVTGTGDAWSVARRPGVGGGAVTVTGADGLMHDKPMLDQLLGGISYEAFRSILAFGLTELQTLDALSGEHIAGAIYGAGLGTPMNAMPNALKHIQKRMDALFKNRAGNPVMNQLAGKLEDLQKTLHDASREIHQYDTTCDALTMVEKELLACRNTLSRARQARQRHDTLERLWPDWMAFQESRRALLELPPPTEGFPDDGLATFEGLAELRDRHNAVLGEIATRRKKLSDQLEALVVDEQILTRAEDIASLVENRNLYVENSRSLPLITRDARIHQDNISRLLTRLGRHWTEHSALIFDRSLFTRDTIRKHQAALEALERNLSATETLLADKKVAAHQAEEACRLAEKEVTGAGGLPPQRNPDLIRRLRQGLDRFSDALAEHTRMTPLLSEARDELAHLEHLAGQGGSGTPWPVVAVAGVGAIATGAVLYFGSYRDAAAALGGALVATWAAWVYRKQQRQMRQNNQARVRQQQLRLTELQARCRQLETIQAEYSQLTEASGATDSGPLPGETLLVAVERFFSHLSEEDIRREAVLRVEHRLEEKKAAETTARHAFEKILAERLSLEILRTEERSAWADRCHSLGLSTTLSPETALEALDVIDAVVDACHQRDRCRTEEARLAAELATYHKKTGQTLSAVGWPVPAEDALPRTVNDLLARLEESKGNKRETEALDRQMASLEKERFSAEETLRDTEGTLRKLIAGATLPDEATFRQTGRTERTRSELQSTADAAEGNLRRISGEIDTAPLTNTLGTLSLADITARKEAADGEVRDLDTELSTLYARRAELKQALETLSTGDDVSRLRAEEAALLTDLAENAREWSRHALAGHLIQQARDIFEHKHQPRIVQDAGTMFSQMTAGRYQGVVSPLGENTLAAVARNGERISPDRLSRGTAEQLYLAVRFGYIRHQARTSDPLPVIMDDILVNFDPVRARKAAEAICDLSKSHQVLLFTCHPETVGVFQEIDPFLPVCRLDTGRIFPPGLRPVPETEGRL